MNRTGSIVAVIVAAACFGTLAVFASLAYDAGAEPLQLLTYRFVLASLLLFGFLALRSPASIRASWGDIGRYAMLALFGYGAASICFFFAIKHTDASVVAVLLYTYPAMVVVAEAAFFGKRFTPGRLGAVLLAFCGCVLVLDPFSSSTAVRPLGVALGLGAAVGYATFSILSHRWLPGRSRLVLMAYTFGVASVGTAVVALLSGATLSAAGWEPAAWLLLALIVIFPTFAAVILYLGGIARLGPSQASIISTFEPIFTILLAAVVLNERLSPLQWAGALLVVAAVVVAERDVRPADDMAVI